MDYVSCDPQYDCSIISKERVDLNDDSHFSREVFLLDDVLPNYIFPPRKAEEPPQKVQASNSTAEHLIVPVKNLTKFEQCKIDANSTEDLEMCKKLSDEKKPTNQEQKIVKTNMTKVDEMAYYLEEERQNLLDQDTGKEDFKIKDGFFDDFENETTTSTSTTPSYSNDRKNANSIPTEKRPSQTPSVEHEEPKENLMTVPGDQHSTMLGDLESEEHYIVSIRACLKSTFSRTPCGAMLTMHASPINLSTASFFKKYNISIV